MQLFEHGALCIALRQRFRRGDDLPQRFALAHSARDKPGARFGVPQGLLRAADNVPHGLAARAAHLRDLKKREIAVVVQVVVFPLLVRQQVAVKIKEHGAQQRVIHKKAHLPRSFRRPVIISRFFSAVKYFSYTPGRIFFPPAGKTER